MTITGRQLGAPSGKTGHPFITAPPPSSAACSRPACSRQARLYHPALAGTPPEEGNWNYLGGLFPTPLYHLGRLFQTRLYHGSAELAERPASMQA